MRLLSPRSPASATLLPYTPLFRSGAWIDRAVFGTDHLWRSARTWDPEGLLSTLPAIATVLLGVFAGSWLRSDRDPAHRAVGLFRSEEHTSELQSRENLVCRLLLEK